MNIYSDSMKWDLRLKKKLPVCSQDFRMKQGFEPTEFPCDTPLLPDEQQEGVISSEISVETPSKTIESLKYSLDHDFGDSEQPLDSVKHEVIQPESVDIVSSYTESQDVVSIDKSSSVSDGFSGAEATELASDDRKDNVVERTVVQTSENVESFEELSIPDQSGNIIESSVVSDELHLTEESKITSDSLSDVATESDLNNMQPPRPSEPKPYEQGSYPTAPSRLELDQFVFIDQTQDIIDDSYNLYDIQESLQSSLACDLNYVDVKSNIEDECTDDSEKEWKRNEDIKNTLNASFLSSGSNKRLSDDQVESILDESEKSNLDENKDHVAEVDELKSGELNLDDEDDNKSFIDKKYLEDLESTDVIETEASKESDFESINYQTDETSEIQLSLEFSEDIKTFDTDYELKDSLSADESQISECLIPENAEEKTDGAPEDLQQTVELVTQPCQEGAEVSSSVTTEDISVAQEDILELSEELEAGPKEDISLSEDQQIDVLEDLEAPEELSDNGNESSDDSLAPSTHSSVSTQIAVSMKIGLKEPEPDESSLFDFSENLENDNEVSVIVSLSTSAVAGKSLCDEKNIPLEHVLKSEDIEEPELIPERISSSDLELCRDEEYESDIKGFEFGENIEADIEQAMLEGDKFTPTPPLESDSYIAEFDLNSLIHENSMADITDAEGAEPSNILQSSENENDQFILESSDYPGIYEKYEIQREIISEDVIDEVTDTNNNVSEFITVKEEGFVGAEDFESILSKDTEMDNVEVKVSEPESIETAPDSLLTEENDEESVMSHFYDEWYHNVQPSTQFSLLSADSIYAKYGTTESSESGNESGEENVTNIVASEDVAEEEKVLAKESLEEPITLEDQMKDVEILEDQYDEIDTNFIDEAIPHDIAEKSKFEEISGEIDLLQTISKESEKEFMQNQEISGVQITEESDIIQRTEFTSYLQERTETVTVNVKSQESSQSVDEQVISDTKSVKSKFNTSKSCQTEDSFEEDIFFDSFDDTFTVPSYIHLPIEVQAKPPTCDMSIQCEIISTDDISGKISRTSSEISTLPSASQADKLTDQDIPKEPKLSDRKPKQPDSTSDDKDESSCESFEDSDSDIFIESHSSHDELEAASTKKGLYAEIDSDTGFSSGSESGWITKSQKQLKGKKTLDSSVTNVQSQEITGITLSSKKEISGTVQTYVVKSSCESLVVESQITEILSISEKGMASENVKMESVERDTEVCSFPPEIIERAVTPVAVPQFPSFEEDLVFVEVEESVEEDYKNIKEEVTSTSPTVEYFYGPLPGTIKIESPPDMNERFFETTSEFSESLFYTLDSVESFSDSSISSEQIPKGLSMAAKETDILEDESFADTCSSFKAEDSVSEYYALPESSVKLTAAIAESSEVTSDKTVDSTSVTCVECVEIAKEDDLETSEFIVAAEHVLPDDRVIDAKTQEVTEIKILDTSDNQHFVSESKEAMTVGLSEVKAEHGVLSKSSSSEEMAVSPESLETENVDVKKSVDSGKLEKPVSDDSALKQSEDESVVPIKTSPDVPFVPSDIIRYLYYDDSITFDDDSYHTQSEMLELPSLPADESHPVASTVVLSEKVDTEDKKPLQDTALLEKSTDEVYIEPSVQPVSESKNNLIIAPVQKSVSEESDEKISELVVQESQEIQTRLEESAPEEIFITAEAELKLATVEIISSENVIELPSEQIPKSVQKTVSFDENISETVITKDSSTLPLDTESEDIQPIELKKTSPEVPQVPSDIVRYLYYEDDITFEESNDITFDDTSFHSQSDDFDALDFDIGSASAIKPELQQEDIIGAKPERKRDSCEESSSSYKHDSSSMGEESIPPLDSSECIDKWFDLEADKSVPSSNGKKEKPQNSEQHSSTKSSALKDSEQPCIPEYILSPIPEGSLPGTKTDIDEVTDISTHFTMTDDSDKFSDIESDTSLNFEEECILPLEVEAVHLKSAVLFESSLDDEEDDMNLPTPEVKSLPGGFQFPTPELPEQIEEFVDQFAYPVEPVEQQEEFDECITSAEFSEGYKEQFAECLTPVDAFEQPSREADLCDVEKEHLECVVLSDISESKEQFTECLISSEQPSKETTFYDIEQDHIDQELKEFHESDNLNEVCEVAKEQFSECLTSSELSSQEPVLHEVHLDPELKEKFEECITSADISEHFTECLTSSEIRAEESVYEISHENIHQLEEQSVEYLATDMRDENGNIPDHIEAESFYTDSVLPVTGAEMIISSEKFKVSSQSETAENIIVAKDDEAELSCYTSPIEETCVNSFSHLAETEKFHVCSGDASSPVIEVESSAVDKDEDTELSCYTSPNEDSIHNEEDSLSAEVADWTDAECKNVEESIYDLPIEEMKSEEVIYEAAHIAEESCFIKSFESVSSDIESKKIVSVLCEVEKELTSQILEEKETFLKSDELQIEQSDVEESAEEQELFTDILSTEKNLEASSNIQESLFSSDMKDILEVKMETESEISIAMKQEVNNECMSAVSGTEPNFLQGGTMHDTQEVQSEELSSKELCGDEKVITDVLSQPNEKEISGPKTVADAVLEEINLTSEVSEISFLRGVDLKQTKDLKEIEFTTRDEKDAFESPKLEKELEVVSLTAKSEIVDPLTTPELLETSDSFTSECIATVSSESAILENIPLAVKKVIYEEPDFKEALKVELQEFSVETDTKSSREIEAEVEVDRKCLVDEEDSQFVNFKFCDELETVNYKGDFAVESTEEKTEIVCKESDGNVTAKDFKMSEISDFKMDLESSEIIRGKIFKTREEYEDDKNLKVSEKVDFKMQSDGTGFIDNEINVIKRKDEFIDFKGQLKDGEENISKIAEVSSISGGVQDLKSIAVKDVSHKIIESSEIVDFKGQDVSADLKSFMMMETSIIVKESTEPKFDGNVISLDKSISSEKVDFKGQLDVSKHTVEFKKEEISVAGKDTNKPFTVKEKKFKSEESGPLLETIDFKGQAVSGEMVDFKGENVDVQSESTSYFKGRIGEEKLNTTDISNVNLKIDGSVETVDFKGQVLSSYEQQKETTFVSIKDTKTVTELKDSVKAEEIFEAVDFKGSRKVDEDESLQREVFLKPEDIKHATKNEKELKADVLKSDTVSETVEFQVTIYSDSEVRDSKSDISQVSISDERIKIDTVREVHGVHEEEITFESHGAVYHEQYATTDSVSNEASAEESSELYSCVETLSAADTSLQFYSLSDDLDDTLNITSSEDFTDVPSHFTSTEGSDKWSDVEGDLSVDEAEFDKDKTPTRTTDDSMITKEKEVTENELEKLDETSKSDPALEKFLLESSECTIISKSIEQDIVMKHEERIAESANDMVSSERKTSEGKTSDAVSYFKSSDSVAATEVTTLMEKADMKERSDDHVFKDHEIKEVTHKVQESSDIVDFKGQGLIGTSKIQAISQQNSMREIESAKELHRSVDQKVDSAVIISPNKNIKLSPAEKSIDLHMTTSKEDYSDVTSYQLSAESSEKWSDVKSEMLPEDLKVDFKDSLATESKPSWEIASDSHVDQILSGDSIKLSMELKRDTESELVEDSSPEAPLMEHFADIKSLHEPLTVADTFSLLDVETAVSRTHEDSTDISSQFEKTESDHWLEVATDNSVSEFAEDIAPSVGKEESKQETFSDKIAKEGDTTIPSSQLQSEMVQTNTISTTSSYADLENLDQTSDTCADFSLQGATTESSDKLSDIEAEALIDDVLYGNVDLTEKVESTDFAQPIKKLEEKKEIEEISLRESQLVALSSTETTEVHASSATDVLTKNESVVKTSSESKYELLKLTKSSLSSEGPDSSPINLTDSGPSSILTETSISSLISSPSNVAPTGLSDDELTNVTPLDITTEESDKWSDISDDTSLEGIEDSSVSLKANIKLQDLESETVSSEFKVGLPREEPDSFVVEESKSFDLKLEFSKTEDSGKETLIFGSSTEEKEELLQGFKMEEDSKSVMKVKKDIEEIFPEAVTGQRPGAKAEVTDTQALEKQEYEVKEISDFSFKIESKIEAQLARVEEVTQSEAVESIKLKSEVTIEDSYVREQIQIEDSSHSKITDESETLDTYNDVLTHTYSPETSEGYYELESDHSVEEIETQYVEGFESPDIQQISRQTLSECYENSLLTEELAENVDEYGLGTIPENELENYEDEEYSLSEHFEINEDELIYPLPYNDWIEQSFELKEYGIEAAFSESGSDIHGLGITSDIHGLGIANEEYDDEDIQRAIDFNISNFEDEGDNNVGTTESFKTFSNDISPHLRHSDKEYDSFSTADAPSIEEEEDFADHDNLLSKIDELLAEDFGDLDDYQAQSPLKQEEDVDDYYSKDISTPDHLKSEEYAEIEKSSLHKDTLSYIDKDSKFSVSEAVLSEVTLKKDSIATESVSSELVKKESKKIESDTVSSDEVTLKRSFKIPVSEPLTGEVTLKKDSEISEQQTVSFKTLEKKDSKISQPETVSFKISEKKDSKISESETISSKISLQKDSKISEPETVSFKTLEKKDSTISEQDTVSFKIAEKKDSKISEPETVSFKISEKKDSKISESETVSSKISLQKDSKVSESDSVTNEISLKKYSKLSEPEIVASKLSLKKESELSEPETVTSKLSLKKVSNSDSLESVSDEIALQKDFKSSTIETVSSKISLKKDSKFSESEAVSSKITLQEDSKKSEMETVSSKISLKKDFKLSEPETISIKMTVEKDSKTSETESISSKISAKEDSKVSESESKSKQISVKQTIIKTSSEEAETVALMSKDEIKEAKFKTKDSLLTSEEAGKVETEATHLIPLKKIQPSSVEADASVKLKSSTESTVVDCGKGFISTSDETCASIVLSSETDFSFDIPSKQSAKSVTASTEYTVKETTTKLSVVTKTIQSSQQLSESSKSVLDSESNIPGQKKNIDTYSVSEKLDSGTFTIISKEQTSTDSTMDEVKPDIPRKTKRKSLDSKEGTLQKEDVEKKPSLPPKLSKRHSTSESPSSSLSESLSSSSSVESIGSFESATSRRSRKSSLKSSEDASFHSESPEVPARRSRSSKTSSTSRSRSRDSEDSSSSSSLRIRRRSSNFREPEPIDLSKKRASIDERMQKLQNEGKCANKEKAFIAAKLIEMQFEEEDALLAARQCNSVYHAVKFLTQLCDLCNCRFPINLMASMIHCTHRACKECLKAHFTSLIYDRSIFTLLCPICHKPDITDQNIQEYFNHLDMMLRGILEDRVYDLFQRKLRDEVLTKDPNFHWCSQCSSGFIASPRLKKLYCPDCSAITCALCHQTWELEHEGVHCERFQQWKDMHTPEPPPAGTVKFLADRGISCPSCGIVYEQACGGCMMYKCSHCSSEFCGFCIHPCKKGKECSNEICESRGLHIHHLHNCLYFLRDKDISEIQMLLEEESVTYLTIPPKDQIVKSRCQVREQKYAHGVITEDRCGRDIEPYCGGLCRTHYYEYLTELLRMNNISPLSIMTIQDLQFMLRKSRILVPERVKGEKSEDYYERLLKLITSTLT